MYINELARRLKLDSGNLTRKLKELEQEGILRSKVRGAEHYYSLNPAYPLLKEYRQIILKTVGFEQSLKKAFQKIKGIQQAYLFGSYAQNKMDAASDVDVLVVGSHSTVELQREVAKVQKTMDRALNAVSMTAEEYESQKDKDPFLRSICQKKRIRLL